MLFFKRIILIITASYLLIGPQAVYPSGNPYDLTTEDELISKDRQHKISTYWGKREQGLLTGYAGVPIRYSYTLGKQEKGAVVIINGRGETYLKYKETAYDLHNQGYSVYMYDHRGQGLSGRMLEDPQIGHIQDFDNYVHDLNTFYRDVVEKNGEEKVYLLAHSMGGAIAALYLEKYRQDFQAAALSAPMMEINTGCVPTALSCMVANGLKEFRELMGWSPAYVPFTGPYEAKPFSENRLSHSLIRYEIFTGSYEARPEVKLGGPSRAWVSESCKAGRKARQEAGRIRIPILLLQAGNDKLVTAGGQREFCDNLAAGGNSRCWGGEPYPVENAYHEILLEKDEYRIPALTTILDFFGSH